MGRLGVRYLVGLASCSIFLQLVSSQCDLLSRSDLAGEESGAGLISEALRSSTGGSSLTNISLVDYSLVCLSTGGTRDTFGSASVVAEYTEGGGSGSTHSQFEFECGVNGAWRVTAGGSNDSLVTTPPDATLNTTLRSDCSLCLNPRRPEATSNNSQHCEECNSSCFGLNLCTRTSCCNVFDPEGQCSIQCPLQNAITNRDFTCTCVSGYSGSNCTTDVDDCSPNPCLNGGRCTDGGANSFLCNCTEGYVGDTCQELVCSGACLNGGTCAIVGGAAACRCQPGFEGSSCQDISSDGCGTSCFIAIIVVVIGLILFVTVTIIIITIATLFRKDKKVKKYKVHKKHQRRKKATSSASKGKRRSGIVQQGRNAPPPGSEPQVLRVTLEPLEVAEDELGNSGQGNGDMWTREVGNGDMWTREVENGDMWTREVENGGAGTHSTFQVDPRRSSADKVSMELSNF